MKKFTNKKYLKVLLGTTLISPFLFVPTLVSINGYSNNIDTSYSLKQNSRIIQSRTLNYDWKQNNNQNNLRQNNYTIPTSYKNNNWDISTKLKDDVVYDNSNSFASITSSNKDDYKYDQITKFWLNTSGDYTDNNSSSGNNTIKPSVPGTPQWMVKKSDLATVISATDNETEILSMAFSGGGQLISKSLFVLLGSTNSTNSGTYLFQIKWENDIGKVDTNNIKAGQYRLIKKISDQQKDYNFISIDSPSTHSMRIFETTKVENNTSDHSIKSISISNNDFGQNTSSLKQITYTIKSSILTSKIANKVYYPIFSFTPSSIDLTTSIIFQLETFDQSNKDKSLFVIRLDGNAVSNTEVNQENAISTIDLSSMSNDIGSNKFKTTFLNRNNTSFDLFFTSSNTNKFATKTYDFLDSTQTNLVVSKDYPLASKSNFLEVKKLYSLTSELIGYIVLTTDQKIYKLDLSFGNQELICDFESFTFDLGKIFKIFTIPSTSTWFAQMQDSTFAQFEKSTLIGQWDKITENKSLELPLSVSIKSQNQIKLNIITHKVYDDFDNPTAYDDKFNDLLADPESYKEFLEVNFQDPRVTLPPNVTVSASTFSKPTDTNNKKYPIELTFTQKLREINTLGQVIENGSTTDQVIAKQTYIFNNSPGEVVFENQNVPAFLKNKLPSTITESEIINYLVNIKNVDNYILTKTYNDSTGTLRVRILVPYMWEAQDGGGQMLVSDKVFSWTYDKDSNGLPFFAANPLGKSAWLTEVDDKYIEDPKNIALKNDLILKYSSKLPSEVSKKEIIESFVLFGPAFYLQSNIDDGNIILPSEDEGQVNVLPFNDKGYAKIDLLFPKIGHERNIRLSFETPRIFAKNPAANANVYFMYKENQEILNTQIGNKKISEMKPSELEKKITSTNIGNNTVVIENLRYFANFSNYFQESINNGSTRVEATAFDKYGTLKINVQISEQDKEDFGLSSNSFSTIIDGLVKETNTSLTNDNFAFRNVLKNSSSIGQVSPINVTVNDLMNTYEIIDDSVSQDTKLKVSSENIKLIPSTISGTLQVIVDIENYVENGNVIPVKTFSKIYSGFLKTKEVFNMIVWKSFTEIVEQRPGYSSQLPSNIVELITNSKENNLEKLMQFATISLDLEKELNPDDITLILVANNSLGELEVNVKLTFNNEVFESKTIIGGFMQNGSLLPSITFISPSHNDLLELKIFAPSELNDQQISKLFNIDNSFSYKNSVDIIRDDENGSIELIVYVKDENGNILSTAKETYSGFKSIVKTDKKTNWFVVVASGIIPAMILIIPILLILFLSSMKNRKKIAKTLDERLDEEYENSRNKKR